MIAIAITDIQTVSELIMQQEIEDNTDEDSEDIVPSLAEAIKSLIFKEMFNWT